MSGVICYLDLNVGSHLLKKVYSSESVSNRRSCFIEMVMSHGIDFLLPTCYEKYDYLPSCLYKSLESFLRIKPFCVVRNLSEYYKESIDLEVLSVEELVKNLEYYLTTCGSKYINKMFSLAKNHHLLTLTDLEGSIYFLKWVKKYIRRKIDLNNLKSIFSDELFTDSEFLVTYITVDPFHAFTDRNIFKVPGVLDFLAKPEAFDWEMLPDSVIPFCLSLDYEQKVALCKYGSITFLTVFDFWTNIEVYNKVSAIRIFNYANFNLPDVRKDFTYFFGILRFGYQFPYEINEECIDHFIEIEVPSYSRSALIAFSEHEYAHEKLKDFYIPWMAQESDFSQVIRIVKNLKNTSYLNELLETVTCKICKFSEFFMAYENLLESFPSYIATHYIGTDLEMLYLVTKALFDQEFDTLFNLIEKHSDFLLEIEFYLPTIVSCYHYDPSIEKITIKENSYFDCVYDRSFLEKLFNAKEEYLRMIPNGLFTENMYRSLIRRESLYSILNANQISVGYPKYLIPIITSYLKELMELENHKMFAKVLFFFLRIAHIGWGTFFKKECISLFGIEFITTLAEDSEWL